MKYNNYLEHSTFQVMYSFDNGALLSEDIIMDARHLKSVLGTKDLDVITRHHMIDSVLNQSEKAALTFMLENKLELRNKVL